MGICYRSNVVENGFLWQVEDKNTEILNKRYIYILIALILLIAVRCIFDTSAVHIFYVVTFIALFLSISRWSFIDKSLSFLGTYSMNMWFIHTCICYYLFKDFIYGFKYPIIIYTVVVVLSLIFAIFVTKIANIVIPKARK